MKIIRILILLAFLSSPAWAQSELINSEVSISSETNKYIPPESEPVEIPEYKKLDEKMARERIEVLEAKSMDILDVLDFIEDTSGLTILVDENISGEVSIYLKDVDVRDALRIILDTLKLAFRENNGLIKVMTAEEYQTLYGKEFNEGVEIKSISLQHVEYEEVRPLLAQLSSPQGKLHIDNLTNTVIIIDDSESIESMVTLLDELDVPLETEIFSLMYANVKEVSKKIEEVLTDKIGRVQYDEKSNKITVTDTHLKIKEISVLIKKLDEEDKQYVWKTKTLQITLNDEHETGVDWEAIVSDYQSVQFNGFTNTSNEFQTKQICIGTVSGEDYPILLEALDTVGVIQELSNEDILAEGLEAVLTVNTRDLNLGLDMQEKRKEKVNHEQFRLNLSLEEVEEGFKASLDPEIYLLPSALGEPKVLKSSVKEKDVVVHLKKGATVVVGGLFKEVPVEYIRKIPILGEIPFLGFAFRLQKEQLRNTEIITFLSAETRKK